MVSKQMNYFSFKEISSQPEAWSKLIPLVMEKAETLQRVFSGVGQVIFIGCGSGLNASLAGAPVFQAKTRIPARAIPAFDVYKFPESLFSKEGKTVAVLSSRSGKTTEVVNAMRYLHEIGIPTIGITCSAESPLAQESNLPVVMSPVIEQAVVTTRSLTGMILTMQLITAVVTQDQSFLTELENLPERCERRLQVFHDIGKEVGERADLARYSFLANSPFFGVAHECQLKVKEMVLLPSDCYPVLDFRHGPQSNVDERMLVTLFFSDAAEKEEIEVLKDMKALNGVTWVICERANPGITENADYLVEVNSGLGQYARGILYLPAVQYMAFYRAISLNLNPDHPHNLSYWVDTSRK